MSKVNTASNGSKRTVASRRAVPESPDIAGLWEQSVGPCSTRDQMAGALRELLVSGTFQVGYRLPSIRRFQQISGLRQYEVCQALDTLANEGLIEQRRGSGTFVRESRRTQPLDGRETLRIGVVPPSWDPAVSHHAVAMFLSGITEQAGLRHTVLVLPARVPEQAPLSFAKHVRSLGVDGIIWIKPPVAPPPALVCLVAAGVPVVVVDRPYAQLPIASAAFDHRVMGEEIAEFLVRKGRRKLLFMAGVRNDQLMIDQIEALRDAMERRGLSLPDDQIVTVRIASAASVYSTDLRESVASFFRRHADFDAVFSVYSDQFDVLTALHESGTRRCPEDFIHIHKGSANVWAGQQWPPFPTALLSSPSEAVGRQAVKELERILGVNEHPEPEDLGPRIEVDPY